MARRKPANRKPGPTPVGRAPSGGTGELRIIGGDWRSRKLRFPDAGGVRPSPARTRETLFNWLNFQIAGSDCLDLFAGSGAWAWRRFPAVLPAPRWSTIPRHWPAPCETISGY